MVKFTRILTYSEPTYGLLWIGEENRRHFPSPSEPVTIIDADGKKYTTKMHKEYARIDGLTDLHRKLSSKPGQAIIIEVKPEEPGCAHVYLEDTQGTSPNPPSTIQSESEQAEALSITASLESMLEDFIANNLPSLEPNLKMFKDSEGILGRQYNTEVGLIDLLCVDARNNLVVVELKRGRESDKVVGQISRYMGWVKAKLADGFSGIRGIVIVHKPTDKYPKDDKLEYAILANPNLQLKYYEITLKFL